MLFHCYSYHVANFDAKMDIMQFHIIEKESESIKTRTITMEMIAGNIWRLNKKPYDMNRIDERVKLGTTEIWVLKNTAHMGHPL